MSNDAGPRRRLWSPWRSQHIEEFMKQHRPSDGAASVFARMASEDKDDENLILWRGRAVFIVMNLYPYNNGHVLIVPYRAEEKYQNLTTDEKAEMSYAMDRAIEWIDAALEPDGFNIGINLGEAGGAGIPEHLHMHVIPRWLGDTNFMATAADVKVIPESIVETYWKIKTSIDRSRP